MRHWLWWKSSRKPPSPVCCTVQDDRLVVVVGPCSIHHHEQAMDLRPPAQGSRPMRCRTSCWWSCACTFEKPRTTVGWKGYINDPHLDGSFAINEGLEMARTPVARRAGAGPARSVPSFWICSARSSSADLVSWGAIGARTTESQSHRQLASGLSCPVGFKNGTDGGVKVATDAIQAAQSAVHAFMGMTKMGQAAVFETRGNQDCHVILRGGKQPNYSAADVDADLCLAAGRGPAPAGDGRRIPCQQQQAAPAPDRGGHRRGRADCGRRPPHHRRHDREPSRGGPPGHPARPPAASRGVSVTDACISMAQTVPVLQALAQAVRTRRAGR
jgi:3-deoxy-7-phosphoheptulonate synthase